MNYPAKTGERPTMEMVASVAGVSKITVSRALRGSDLVRPELRERISQIASDLGYRMNVAARSLRTRRTQTIAVLVEQLQRDDRPITDPLLLTMIGGLLEVLTPADYAMLLTTKDHFLASSAIAADGVVVLGQGEGGSGLTQIDTYGLPMVAWGAPMAGLKIPVIGSDNRQGGRLAAEHLVAAGRKRVLFLGDTRHPEVAGRLEGVRDVLAASEASLACVVPCAFSAESGAKALQQTLDSGITFDAVVAVSDFIAAGACDTLMARNIAVPNKVAIVGFDDTPIASAHRPSLTSVRQDATAAGRALAQAVLAIVEDASSLPDCTPLPVELIARESSA